MVDWGGEFKVALCPEASCLVVVCVPDLLFVCEREWVICFLLEANGCLWNFAGRCSRKNRTTTNNNNNNTNKAEGRSQKGKGRKKKSVPPMTRGRTPFFAFLFLADN